MTNKEFRELCSDLPEKIIINDKVYIISTVVNNHNTTKYKGQTFVINYRGLVNLESVTIFSYSIFPEKVLETIVNKLYHFGYKHKEIHGRLA